MGCDIHLYVERRVNGRWESCDQWERDEDDSDRETIAYEKRFYSDRNYNLFAILADVRNGRGFAGVRTGNGLNPICAPKGLPADVSPKVRAESDSWDCDGHSHSWHTLADLLAYDWTQVSTLCGYVDVPTFAQWERWGRKHGENPESWCGGVGGPGIRHVTEDEMRALIAATCEGKDWPEQNKALAALTTTYTHCEWTQPYYKSSGSFFGHVIPRLLRLGKPEDVRIVFWFDN